MCEMSTPSTPTSASGSTPGATRRRWASRGRSRGSVSRRRPATSTRTVACPIHLMWTPPSGDTGTVRIMAQLGEPAAHLAVHGVCADDHLVRQRPVARDDGEGEALLAAHATVRADQLLEGRHLVGLLPVGAVE